MRSPLDHLGGGDGKATKVLIVEDEFLVAMQIEDILTENGFEVIGVVADSESLDRMTIQPDIALVDLNLRDGPTGNSIAQKLSEAWGTRVVYVTANPAQIEEPAATAIGILPKPFSREAINAAMSYASNLCNSMPHELLPVRQAG